MFGITQFGGYDQYHYNSASSICLYLFNGQIFIYGSETGSNSLNIKVNDKIGLVVDEKDSTVRFTVNGNQVG